LEIAARAVAGRMDLWQIRGSQVAGANSPGEERPVPSAHVCRCRRPDSFCRSCDELSSDESWESHGRKIAESKHERAESVR